MLSFSQVCALSCCCYYFNNSGSNSSSWNEVEHVCFHIYIVNFEVSLTSHGHSNLGRFRFLTYRFIGNKILVTSMYFSYALLFLVTSWVDLLTNSCLFDSINFLSEKWVTLKSSSLFLFFEILFQRVYSSLIKSFCHLAAYTAMNNFPWSSLDFFIYANIHNKSEVTFCMLQPF